MEVYRLFDNKITNITNRRMIVMGGGVLSIENIDLRLPVLEDGMAVFRLIENCPPLDINSSYCNLLQCSHFASTSVASQMNGELVGFISAYIIPDRPNTLFIWQVAVAEQARGIGLASHMLTHILTRPQCASIAYLETTITEDNSASWALFKRLAKSLSAEFLSAGWMDKKVHFAGKHDSEALVHIGPFNSPS
jgi:L-2,4-diaminobutyric acid acetyltransferase